ncbi:hypothetical protein Ddye_004894 [Dipteronia dyeriana]|uniref:Uncharacterized protein n=1 Tax=Dipteronia dyeriana TaxID=168575 RepID=A0AAE0CP69_9ROSI|nr:hypothetical protein Ddye_004894 [Dipteronia dyeriana]
MDLLSFVRMVVSGFFYEACWADNETCKEVVRSMWLDSSGVDGISGLVKRLSCWASQLKGWNDAQRNMLRKNIKLKYKELYEASRVVNSNSWLGIRRIENQLDELLLQEELCWKQRSRVDRLRCGDKNTKYFHARAFSSRTRNQTLGLLDENGSWQEKKQAMEGVSSRYFDRIFSSSNSSSEQLGKVLTCVVLKLSDSSSRMLDQPFSKDDVKRALFDMCPTKAPG